MNQDQLRRFRDGTLTADQVLHVGRHLRVCADCRKVAAELFPPREAERELHTAIADVAAGSPARRARAGEPAPRSHALAAAAVVIAALGVGGWVVLTRQGAPPPALIHPPRAAALDYGRADWNALVGEARKTGELPMPGALRELRRRSDTLRGASGHADAALLAPTGVVVESNRPELSWTLTPGAIGYCVLVYANDAEIAHSGFLRVASWQPQTLLRRGVTYEWQVIAKMRNGRTKAIPSPPDPPALFTVLSDAAVTEIAEAARRFPNDHLLRGLLYARHGVADRAREELRLSTDAAGPSLARSVAAWDAQN